MTHPTGPASGPSISDLGKFTFAQTVQYARRRFEFGLADHFGAGVVHQDLVQAVLEHGTVNEVHLFLDTYSEGERSGQEASLRELRHDVGHSRVHVKRSLDLPALASTHRYVFVTPGVDILALAQVRQANASVRFPICGLLHSIDGPDVLLRYLALTLFAEEYDRIVVSSRAGLEAVKRLLDGAAAYLEERTGAREQLRVGLSLIPLAVDTSFLHPHSQPYARATLGLPESAKLILYLGRFDEHQKADLEPLLLTCKILFAAVPDAYLVLAGQDVAGDLPRKSAQVVRDFGNRRQAYRHH